MLLQEKRARTKSKLTIDVAKQRLFDGHVKPPKHSSMGHECFTIGNNKKNGIKSSGLAIGKKITSIDGSKLKNHTKPVLEKSKIAKESLSIDGLDANIIQRFNNVMNKSSYTIAPQNKHIDSKLVKQWMYSSYHKIDDTNLSGLGIATGMVVTKSLNLRSDGTFTYYDEYINDLERDDIPTFRLRKSKGKWEVLVKENKGTPLVKLKGVGIEMNGFCGDYDHDLTEAGMETLKEGNGWNYWIQQEMLVYDHIFSDWVPVEKEKEKGVDNSGVEGRG
eukprot:TRINITY_DN1236_c0_g2_i1.p1 TRINITY_DN1236_c0_g2~~TRINITY_DN1236_c0_g2_i1.p1  ORF type:complete len:276 (-),score=51.47 TRINITY_DN1236_c0_g2_i1:90-917(-)